MKRDIEQCHCNGFVKCLQFNNFKYFLILKKITKSRNTTNPKYEIIKNGQGLECETYDIYILYIKLRID